MNDASASQQIDAIVRKTSGWRGERLGQLRALIRGADLGVIEEVKWKKPSRPEGVPVWSHDGIVCIGEALKNAVRLTFPKGALLKDPKGLFNTRLDSKTVRAIDFHEGDAFRADALMASPSWKSMARTVLLSRRVLKSPFGSFSRAPFGNVSLTAFLRASPMQTMPSWDQTGTPSGREGFFHFTSSITPGSAALIRARSWPSLSPLQPVVFRTMASICWDADASFMPMLGCGGSAPSGPKGSPPCPFAACSQANNTADAFLPAVRIAFAGCVGSWSLLSSARAPSRSTHCGQEG